MDLPEGFSLALAAQIERGETLDDDRALDDVPPESINLQVRKNFGKGYFQIRGAAFAALENPGPGEIETPGYGILDLGGGYNVTPCSSCRPTCATRSITGMRRARTRATCSRPASTRRSPPS